MKKQLGVTLIETMVVVAVAALLAVVAAPSFRDSIERSRLKSAVEEHISKVYLAKSESVMKNKPVYYSFRSDQQCYGFRVGQSCDCAQTDTSAADMCTFARVQVDASKGVAMTSTFTNDGTEAFEPARATASGVGQVAWKTASGFELRTGITSVGRVTVCTPSGHGHVAGYNSAGC